VQQVLPVQQVRLELLEVTEQLEQQVRQVQLEVRAQQVRLAQQALPLPFLTHTVQLQGKQHLAALI
jgi:hypothetical protein